MECGIWNEYWKILSQKEAAAQLFTENFIELRNLILYILLYKYSFQGCIVSTLQIKQSIIWNLWNKFLYILCNYRLFKFYAS